jgi:putative membrane protein
MAAEATGRIAETVAGEIGHGGMEVGGFKALRVPAQAARDLPTKTSNSRQFLDTAAIGTAMIERYSDHAANERTFLAWVRSAIAVMAFGFLVEKFDLFLEITSRSLIRRELPAGGHLVGSVAGLLLILMGGAMMVLAVIRFRKTGLDIQSQEVRSGTGARMDMALVGLLTLRWSRPVGQFGGMDKLGSGCGQAAGLSRPLAPYAASGVRPARARSADRSFTRVVGIICQAASRKQRSSRSRLARPYIWRLMVLSRVAAASVCCTTPHG